MEAEDHQDDDIKESMSETEEDKDVKVSGRRHLGPNVDGRVGRGQGGGGKWPFVGRRVVMTAVHSLAGQFFGQATLTG